MMSIHSLSITLLFAVIFFLLLISFPSSSVASKDAPTREEIIRSVPDSRRSHFVRLFNSPPTIKSQYRTNKMSESIDTEAVPTQNVAGTIYPTTYGADPTGNSDSTAAFKQAIAALLNITTGRVMADNIVDLGGATLDLLGGSYLISDTLSIPQCYGNARITGGTLRASSSFNSSAYMLVIGRDILTPMVCHRDGQGSTLEDWRVTEMMFDGQQHAAGGIYITNIMGCDIGPGNFIVGCTKAGITVNGGHETMISNTWIAQFYWDNKNYSIANSTGIEIFGNDNYILNCIVFNGKTGLHMVGAANLIVGLHTWNNNYPKGTGIFMDCAGYTQNRVVASYLDGNHLITTSPEHLVVNECFFLFNAAIVITSTGSNSVVDGLVISSNEWDAGAGTAAILLDESAGKFKKVTDTFIHDNMFAGAYITYSTKIETSLSLNNSDTFCFDLTNSLLFAQFAPTNIQATLAIESSADPSQPVSYYVNKSIRSKTVPADDERTVCITVSQKVSGTVYVIVDQSEYSWGNQKTQSDVIEVENKKIKEEDETVATKFFSKKHRS